jgi:cytochrome c-type biogenesis protein CcmE
MVPIILIGIFNFGGNLVYYILSYAISNTGSSFGTEIVLFGIVEFVGIFPMST